MRMEDLYQEIILDHSRNPHHAGLRDPFDAESHQVNTSCGDEITLRVYASHQGVGDEDIIKDISYDALGCSISQASVSVMTDLLIGKTVAQAREIGHAFHTMVTSKGTDDGDEELLEDAVAFAGVSQYANRVKCALLGWKAFEDASARAAADR